MGNVFSRYKVVSNNSLVMVIKNIFGNLDISGKRIKNIEIKVVVNFI
ncbi:hypothetical protein PROVRETT_08533 [Providencia rettgeri DSM 1131]|nr:hypothetical protein PROVRETT_08533 [Providencia rettgeri DSM 1131]